MQTVQSHDEVERLFKEQARRTEQLRRANSRRTLIANSIVWLGFLAFTIGMIWYEGFSAGDVVLIGGLVFLSLSLAATYWRYRKLAV